MSNTYKTKPDWVKIRRPEDARYVAEYHDHSQNECDISEAVGDTPFYWQRRGSCGYSVNYYGYHGGFYARPRRGQGYVQEHEGRARAAWRKERCDMLKLSREDIEDYDVKTYQHRHSAQWEIL